MVAGAGPRWPAGRAVASAAAGPVLRGPLVRSFFLVLAVALAVNVLGDLAVGLIAARLTADWAADVRRRLCRVAFGQDLPTLETTPVGELLDRIDGDVNQVAAELRGSGVRIAQSLTLGVLSVVTALAGLVAGRHRDARAGGGPRRSALRGQTQADRRRPGWARRRPGRTSPR